MAKMATIMTQSGSKNQHHSTMTSCTADGDRGRVRARDHAESLNGRRQAKPAARTIGCEMRSLSHSDSSSFLSTSSKPSADFSTRSTTGSQHLGHGLSRQFSAGKVPCGRHEVPKEMLGHQPTLATETNRMRTARKLAELSQSSLDFSRVSLLGREKERRILDRAFRQILKNATPAKVVQPSSWDEGAVGLDQNGNPNQRNIDKAGSNESNSSDDTDATADTDGSTTRMRKGNCAVNHSNAETTTIRSLVSISGYSGTGKSTLATTLRPKCKANNVLFVFGKFDLKQMDEPYSGFRIAMIDLCSQICNLPRIHTNIAQPGTQDSRSFDVIRQRITQDLNNDELQSLHKLIPNLVDVIGNDAYSRTNTAEGDIDGAEKIGASTRRRSQVMQGFKEKSIQLKFAFRRFIKIICDCCPLVWVCDDVQWADRESLNMIESWIMDTTISSLMIVICFRSNLVNTDGLDHGTASNRNDIGTNSGASELDYVTVSSTADLVGPMLSSIQKKKRERFIRYVDLEVNNLSLNDVHAMLRQLLGIYHDASNSGNGNGNDNDATSRSYGLAEIVFKKTDGNVFFVQQFMRMLVKDSLLSYDIATMKWMWDNDQIKQETPATINVVELMERKLQQIDTAQYLLPLAACLGSTFSWLLLRTVLQGFVEDGADDTSEAGHRALYESLFDGPPPASEDEWLDILRIYEGEGLIESRTSSDKDIVNVDVNSEESGSDGRSTFASSASVMAPASASPKAPPASEYSFIHDKVQEAALGMVSSKMQLLELQHRIGLILMERLSPDDLESSLFVVANLLNGRLDMIPQYPPSPSTTTMGDTTDMAQTVRSRVAKLNFDAGIIAASHAAFRIAFRYLQHAIDMMPSNHWKSHYQMSLQLYTSATECAYASNKFEMMRKYGNMVIKRDDCPLIDAMRAYHVLMDGNMVTIQNKKASDVMKLGNTLMAKLGYRYPRNSTVRLLTVMKRITRLKASAKTWTIEYLDSMQPSKDPMDELILRTIDKHGWSAAICDKGVHPLITIDGINCALKVGRTSFTPVALASLAMLIGPVLGDMETARLYANYAVKLCETMSNKSAIARTVLVSYGMVLNGLIPYDSCKQPILDAHPDAMAAGDVHVAMWTVLYYLDLCFLTAKPLEDLDADLSTYKKVCEDFNQGKAGEELSMRWQMVLNLRGRSDQQALLVGDVFDEVVTMQRIEQTKDGTLKIKLIRTKVFASAYFGDYHAAAQFALETCDNQLKVKHGYIMTMPFIFLSSFSATIVSHHDDYLSRSKRSKFKRLAKRSRKELRLSVDRGNPNAVHCLAILSAERAAWKAHKKRQEVSAFQAAVELYQHAIRICARTGFPQHQALANERLAEHMLLRDDEESAEYHFDEAIRLYEEWGAGKKVTLLQARRQSVKRSSSEMPEYP